MKKLLFLILLSISLIFSACKSKDKNVDNDVEITPANNEPICLTKSDFLTKVHNFEQSPDKWNFLGEKPCIIFFTKTGCPPCEKLAPYYKELVEKYARKIDFYKVDIDKETFFYAGAVPKLLFCAKNSDTVSQLGWVVDCTQEELDILKEKLIIQRIEDFLLKNKL